jgi:hypothetical protein
MLLKRASTKPANPAGLLANQSLLFVRARIANNNGFAIDKSESDLNGSIATSDHDSYALVY